MCKGVAGEVVFMPTFPELSMRSLSLPAVATAKTDVKAVEPVGADAEPVSLTPSV
jgi:hypothetical protein